MISFPVSLEKQKWLQEKMSKLGICESDLVESFTKSSGHGGQNVNKLSTTVLLKHKPTGIEVKCSVYRTQGLNRYKARAIICEKLEEKLGIAGKKQTQIQKLKRNKLKKQKRQREKYKTLPADKI